jgi:hypothetical protein
MKGPIMYILAIVILYGIMCSPLYAMQEEERERLLDHRHLNLQHDTDDLGDIENGLSDTSALSSPSSTSSTVSLPTMRPDRLVLTQTSPTLTEMMDRIRIENQQKFNKLKTDIDLLDTTIKSQQAQVELLTHSLGILKGKTDFLRAGKGCTMLTTSGCFLVLWLVFAAQYFGWSISF